MGTAACFQGLMAAAPAAKESPQQPVVTLSGILDKSDKIARGDSKSTVTPSSDRARSGSTWSISTGSPVAPADSDKPADLWTELLTYTSAVGALTAQRFTSDSTDRKVKLQQIGTCVVDKSVIDDSIKKPPKMTLGGSDSAPAKMTFDQQIGQLMEIAHRCGRASAPASVDLKSSENYALESMLNSKPSALHTENLAVLLQGPLPHTRSIKGEMPATSDSMLGA